MPVADLWTIGLETLDAVVDAYAAAAVDLPARRYVAVGPPVDDCEQLVVWLGPLFTGLPGSPVVAPERYGLGHPRTLELNVRIVRCVATLDENGIGPSSDEIEQSAQAIAFDLWVLPQGLISQRSAGNYTQLCQDLVIGNCVPFDWSGGVGGVELATQIQIESSL